jgi:choline kinase
VIGMVLAAGKGERLRPLTDALPKTLLPVDGERTILDVVLANFAAVGLERAVVVTGFAAQRVDELVPELERRHGLAVATVFNPKAEEWNNAYSLWCAREHFAAGVLLSNGDTVHPPSVEEDVLAARDGAAVTIAVDRHKPLAAEEMKVHLSPEGRLERINKALDPATAHGEYIGITLIEPAGAQPLADALEATWRRDPGLYYEDGFQELADRGGHVGAAPIRPVDWVEVDDHADLARARAICRS